MPTLKRTEVRAPVVLRWGLLLLTVCLLLTGCASSGTSRGSFTGRSSGIDEIHLFGAPVALNMEGGRVPNGVGLRVYASSSTVAKGQPIRDGVLDILLFEAIPKSADFTQLKPLHVWTFNPKDLKRFEGEASLGTGYRLALSWGEDKPKGRSVTVVARYKPPRGEAIYSLPSSISLAGR